MDKLTTQLAEALRELVVWHGQRYGLGELLPIDKQEPEIKEAMQALAAYDERVAEEAAQSRPSVGRRVRSLNSGSRYSPLGNEAVVVDYDGSFGSGEDGADSGGDYWASGLGIIGIECACIGRPGIDFEFVD